MRLLALALLAPALAAAQPVPPAACPAPRTVVAAPLSGQPGDVTVTEAVAATWQPVTVRDSGGLRCLGYAERVLGINKARWRAWKAERGGFVRLVARTADSAWSQRADAVRAVVATRPAPVVVTPTPAPVDPLPTLDSLGRVLGAPIPRVAATAALPEPLRAAVQRYDSAFGPAAEYLWQQAVAAGRPGADWEWGNYYDRALAYYAQWARTGNPLYLARGHAHALDYRERYLVRAMPPYGSSPHWAQPEGLAAHYALTGDTLSRHALREMTLSIDVQVRYNGGIGPYTDPRITGRYLLSSVLAWQTARDAADSARFAAIIDSALVRIAAWQTPEGLYPSGPMFCDGQFNFMAGLLNDALVATHTRYTRATAAQRASIVTMVTRSLRLMFPGQWAQHPEWGWGFRYATVPCATGGTDVAPDLTGLIVGPYGWAARVTGDAWYRTAGDTAFVALTQGWALLGPKQFNQAYTSSWRYLGWR